MIKKIKTILPKINSTSGSQKCIEMNYLFKINWKITFRHILATLRRNLSKNFKSIAAYKKYLHISVVLFKKNYSKCAYY